VAKRLPDRMPQRFYVERLLQGRPSGIGVRDPAAAISGCEDEWDTPLREHVSRRIGQDTAQVEVQNCEVDSLTRGCGESLLKA
jgi:hypothetical protein